MSESARPVNWSFSTILALLTLIATIAAAVPAFIQLDRDRPLVYFATQSVSVVNPESPDAARVLEVLRANDLPAARAIVKVQNKGNGPANDVQIGVKAPGVIRDVALDPNPAERPVWVTLPASIPALAGDSIANVEVKNLAPGRTLTVSASYYPATRAQSEPTVDVYFDGRQADRVVDLASAKPLSTYSSFRLPLIILAVGVGLTLFVAFISVLERNADLAKAVYQVTHEVLRLTLFPFR